MNPVFEPISENVALSQRIVAQITDAIVRGELKSGSRLPPERELATQFQVSRSAIRDAVKILSGRGLLLVRHGVGIFVAHAEVDGRYETWGHVIHAPGGRDGSIRNLFDIRKTLETQAACWAAERAEPVHLDRLQRILSDARQHCDDLQVLSERDAQFHVAIAEASQNLVLVQVMWTLLGALEEGRRASLRIPNRPLASLEEHERILAAIAAHDAGKARDCMFLHLGSVEQAIVNLYDCGTNS